MFDVPRGSEQSYCVPSVLNRLRDVGDTSKCHKHDNTGFTIFAWFVTLAPPLTVIAVGILIESLTLHNMKAQLESQREYDIAHREYEYYRAKPEQHDTFKRRWHLSIYEELCYRREDRLLIDTLVQQDQAIRGYLVKREIEVHEFWEAMEIDTVNRPTLPPSATAGLIN